MKKNNHKCGCGCDRETISVMKLPKYSLVLRRTEAPKEGEIVAEKGKWNRLPMDGETLIVSYAKIKKTNTTTKGK